MPYGEFPYFGSLFSYHILSTRFPLPSEKGFTRLFRFQIHVFISILQTILNTQSVNTIFSIFNFPPLGEYQLHRILSSTHASSTSYRFYLVFMKTSLSLSLAPSGSSPARRPFLTSFSYHSCHISHLLHR